MHPLEHIYQEARKGTLQPLTIGGWMFSQFGAPNKMDPYQYLSVIPAPQHNLPAYVYCMEDIESPTHLRYLIRGIIKKANIK